MIFDIWRLVVRAMLIIGLTGIVVFILGLVGDPKIIKNKKAWKKWGLILMGLTILMVVIQMVITYQLLLNS
ncbi:MAG: hypothetical protein AAB574_01115 [Patescibacteria group bacterium]